MARSMLLAAHAPPFLFGEALLYAGYLLDQLPYRAGADPSETRLRRWNPTSAQQPFRAIRVWGCEAWALNHSPTLSKTDARASRYMSHVHYAKYKAKWENPQNTKINY